MISRALQGAAALLFAGMVALAVWNLKTAAARCDALAVQEGAGR